MLLLREPVSSHSRFGYDRDTEELGVLSCPTGVLHTSYHAVFVNAGIRRFLSRSLVRADADLFVLFRARVPQDELISDVTADRIAFCVEQCDAVRIRSVKPII